MSEFLKRQKTGVYLWERYGVRATKNLETGPFIKKSRCQHQKLACARNKTQSRH